MFKPNFQYTNTIVKNLTHIARAQAVIANAPLIPKWQVSLRREARELLGFSDEGIRKEISKLLELGVLTKVGKGRSTHYVLS